MTCTNGKPDCGRASAPGYNPLQLCPEHLAAYRTITGSKRPVGEGSNEPRKEYRPLFCGTCNNGRCKLAKVTEKRTDGGAMTTVVAPRAGCPHLYGQQIAEPKEPVKRGSRKRQGPPGLFG